ncbi:MAG TPA: delta(1)-pyrroline-2-carboxylate reductase family protein, partial [Burkholderiaceae bacterium]|nr:delta(1)-pyrroline-2-carboxylate reductase family protein [Burkholderiaceae bacterium]
KILDARATAAALPWAGMLDALQDILAAQRAGRARCPVRNRLDLGATPGAPDAGVLLTMPATDGELAVVKVVTVHGSNPAQQLPAVQAAVLVMDARTGQRLALLDGEVVTERRTAALSALAVRQLTGRSDWRSAHLQIIGAGAQARAHMEAFAACLGVDRLRVQTRSPASAAPLMALAREHGLQAEYGDAASLRTAELIVTATSSSTPVMDDAVAEHAVICAVGAFTARMAELPPNLVRRARCVVDTTDGCRTEAGDLLQAGVDWSLIPQLADATPQPQDVPIIFKSVGSALWDLAAARCWWQTAADRETARS